MTAPLINTPEPLPTLAARLFDEIAAMSPDSRGVSRPAYSDVETAVLDHLAASARAEGLEVWQDAALNLYAALPGSRDAEGVMLVGSHVDSVPQGGNFDGLAGVIAGLVCLIRTRREGVRPPRPVHLLAMRGDESAWFGPCYLGSRLVTGQLSDSELRATHRADGRSLAAHLDGLGLPMEGVRAGRPMIDLGRIAGYIELHIEQGPVLVERGLPLAAVSGIRGNLRHAAIRCEGTAGHSGAVPQGMRHDAVMAVAELLAALEARAVEVGRDGDDLVFTCGMLGTDPARHALTRIPDEVSFSIDIRSLDDATLDRFGAEARALMDEVAARRGVRFVLDEEKRARPARCDRGLVSALTGAMLRRRIPPLVLASGAGHDAAVFAQAGVPAAMLFVRNAHGSHNPDEAMDLGDFELACEVLYDVLCRSGEEDAMTTSEAGPSLDHLSDMLDERGGGTYAFEAVAAEAQRLALDHPAHAAALSLVAASARQIADRFDVLAITTAQAEAQREQFERDLARLTEVMTSDQPGRALALLNNVAAEILYRGGGQD